MNRASLLLPVHDGSHVSEVRRAVADAATEVGFSDPHVGRATLVASEMATNLAKHAGGGTLLVRRLNDGIELLAVDRGPGMGDPERCLRDGYSTAGSAGTGLGAIKRMSDDFGLHTQVGRGTVVLGRLWAHESRTTPPSRFLIGAVSIPITGEVTCGDVWSSTEGDGSVRLAIFDGLGHGPDAALAGEAATDLIQRHPQDGPGALLEGVHQGIRHTRGAAGAVCDLSITGRSLRHAGVGNIAVALIHDGKARQLLSHNGTLGHNAARFRESSYSWSRDDLVILSSDGLTTRWVLSDYPGLHQCDPAVIAAILWRDFQRGRDDATVMVVKER